MPRRPLALLLLVFVALGAEAQRRRTTTPKAPPPLPADCDASAPEPHRPPLCGAGAGWQYYDAGEFRLWWQTRCGGDEKAARAIGDALVADRTYERVVHMIGEPLRDGDRTECRDGFGNGGSAHYDIYLDRWVSGQGDLASTTTTPYDRKPSCQARPTYTTLRSGRYTPAATGHELVHAGEYSYHWTPFGCLDQDPEGNLESIRLLSEATASALELRLYPRSITDGRNESRAESYLQSTEKPIDEYRKDYGYTAYLFTLFLTHVLADDVLKKVWQSANGPQWIIEAIQSGILGAAQEDRLKDVWAQFAALGVNEKPWDWFSRWEWDSVQAKVPFREGVNQKKLDISGHPDGEVRFEPKPLARMSAVYYKVTIDPSVRSLHFLNPYRGPQYERIAVQALIKPDDDPSHNRTEDWTGKERVFLCMDKKSERAKEIILVVSNSSWKRDAEPIAVPDPIRFVGTNIGCWKWKVTSSADSGGNIQVTYGGVTVGMTDKTTASTSDTVFERGPLAVPVPIPIPLPSGYDTYAVSEGSYSWTVSVAIIVPKPDVCLGGSDSGTSPSRTTGVLMIANLLPGEKGYRSCGGWGGTKQMTGICGGAQMDIGWWQARPDVTKMGDDGIIEGSLDYDTSGLVASGHLHSHWRLVPLREE